MALIAGAVIDRFRNRGIQLAGMIAGTAVCYAFGTAWYCFQAGSSVGAALGLCVFPFIPGDLVKMLIAMALGPMIPAPGWRKRDCIGDDQLLSAVRRGGPEDGGRPRIKLNYPDRADSGGRSLLRERPPPPCAGG